MARYWHGFVRITHVFYVDEVKNKMFTISLLSCAFIVSFGIKWGDSEEF